MSSIATKPVGAVDDGGGQLAAVRSCRRGSRRGRSEDPLLGDRARRARARARRPARRRARASSRRRSRGPGRSTRTTSSAPTFPRQRRRHGLVRQRPQPRAALLLDLRSAPCRRRPSPCPGRGEYGKTCTFVTPASSTTRERPLERALVLGREADDHVGRQVEAVGERDAAQVRAARRSGAPSRAGRRRRRTGAGRAGGATTVGVSRSAATSSSLRWLTSIDESRSRASPGVAPASRISRGEVVAGLAVAVAAEVDPGEHDLAVPLRRRGGASRRARPRRDGCARRRARAGSRRSCTRSCSRPGPSRTRARGRAARRPGRSRSRRRRRRRSPASPRSTAATTTTFSGRPGECVGGEVGAAPGDVDARDACAPPARRRAATCAPPRA